ncbi:metallophosphoesterase [Halalkalibacter hemicellulosilyticus]|uniref:Ser/Thr protein phosphatase family protein n=1 Tax=Halalkalibacter hemicellulosilyticusJCM 9152 TaxID=1236971 RepID=W4QH26_9BACI|nr:Ser/Thr protein phosphatase family protein [Halalkalibacter hemicellulosilyticusJCM 9152]
MKKNRMFIFFLIISLLCLFIIFFHVQNNSLVVTQIQVQSEKIPIGFNEFTIVQLSDLHNKSFSNDQQVLLEKVNNANPDLIVFTGDLVDSKKDNNTPSLLLIEGLVQIAPTYFVTGNHEWWAGNFESLENSLVNIGVHVMRNSVVELMNNQDIIQIIGIDDPAHTKGNDSERTITEMFILEAINELEAKHFQILLAHRPEMIPLYSTYDFDLVFSGHAHGGQMRIPFIGGLVAPNQGFLPKYTSGEHVLDDTTMIVNRGLGNSVIPFRLFNRPEIVVVTLKSITN